MKFTKMQFIYVMIIVLVIALGIGLQQTVIFLIENSKLQSKIARLDHLLIKERKIFKDAVDYEQKRKELESIALWFHNQLPSKLEPEKFRSHLTDLSKESGIKIHDLSVRTKNFDFYAQAEFSMTLKGDKNQVRNFIYKFSQDSRLITLKEFTTDMDKYSIQLKIYSFVSDNLKQSKQNREKKNHELCASPKSNIWLWPYKKRIRQTFSEMKILCDERQRYSDTVSKVNILHHDLKILSSKGKIIEAIMQKQ